MNRKERIELVVLYRKWGELRRHLQNTLNRGKFNDDDEEFNGAIFYLNQTSNDIQNILVGELLIHQKQLKSDFKSLKD